MKIDAIKTVNNILFDAEIVDRLLPRFLLSESFKRFVVNPIHN